ncbi:DNA-binding protein [Phaeodactylibacter luteus]|uniref:DNA-binding protein n=1 Tax=Phaeodactylibacter luteus TaxID=1564516 RepID=A0A5C6RN10_9BACT|nr:DNA-binding protein [Phaeodactylibacter luteus]TXB63613.1 DNA-binding protein [Phaeodactylibacter luteus]
MHITYDELRSIKHQLPTGSIKKIADDLGLEEQTVRNYFGAKKFENGKIVDAHLQPGPNGGIVDLQDTRILQAAQRLIGRPTA